MADKNDSQGTSDADVMNTGFIAHSDTDESTSDRSGFPTSESSILSSECSSIMRRVMNEVLEAISLTVKTLTGPPIPKENENQLLPPIDHYRKFAPLYRELGTPIHLQARSYAAEDLEPLGVEDFCIPDKKE